MNILVICDYFVPDRVGGISKSLINEVEGLVALGHQVSIITRRLHSHTPAWESRRGYELFRYYSPAMGSRFYRTYPLFSTFWLPLVVRQLNRRKQFDVVYIHNAFQMAALGRGGLKPPSVYCWYAPAASEVEVESRSGKYGPAKVFLSPVTRTIRRVERAALNNSNVVITRSHFMHREMRHIYNHRAPAQVDVIPLSVDTEKYAFAARPDIARQQLGLPPERTILLTVRRLASRMGLESLVDAMEIVAANRPNVLLLMAGKGYLEEPLKRRISVLGLEDQVRLLGFIPEAALPLYYQAADFSILPTTELEGFGLSTIESLSCGTPVLATPVGANPEVLEPLEKRLIFNSSNVNDIADGILKWTEDNSGLMMREECRRYCLENFHNEPVLARLVNDFEQAAGN